ncbi:hypothetical protein SAMN05192559_104375 [Halobacillus karajensis]|uniref:NAD(FAD)-utilizing dehydrogenase n=1 Tax=Halobacillus karajensis TaxID=195088 RepID=UPI0008A72AF3|nr:NAD(FAD)-utilizing dehydrogenase [Halobacillus karajensis]SEH83206.1 hypothetical protein SAMN05192559_104375 [Halobacillus karajensis]
MNDVTIIGAGVSGVFLAYTLMKSNPHIRVHLIDKGKRLEERTCGRDVNQGCICPGPCEKYVGFAGLGKSEGKFNYTNDFGGRLGEKIGESQALKWMEEVDHILCSFGADKKARYSTKNEDLSKKAAPFGLNVFSAEVRHLGTSLAYDVFQKLYQEMEENISFTFEADVSEVQKKGGRFIIYTDQGVFESEQLVFATGMSGSNWMKSMTGQLGLKADKTRLDLGIRVETRGDQLDAILQETFETKLNYQTETYSATTYCMNPKGRVIRKHQHGLVMADGQNQGEEERPSSNLNFTLFIPRYFDSHSLAMGEAQRIIGEINQRNGRILAQTLGDLQAGLSTLSFSNGRIKPSLKAEPGDLRAEVPDLYIDASLEFFQALERLLGEKMDPGTILYGLDSKFYEPKVPTDITFQTEIEGLYLIGDCSGETHSLSQAAASGIYLGSVL